MTVLENVATASAPEVTKRSPITKFKHQHNLSAAQRGGVDETGNDCRNSSHAGLAGCVYQWRGYRDNPARGVC